MAQNPNRDMNEGINEDKSNREVLVKADHVKVYFKGSLVKVEIGLAKGKKLYDKRADIAKKDIRREAEKEFKVRNLY